MSSDASRRGAKLAVAGAICWIALAAAACNSNGNGGDSSATNEPPPSETPASGPYAGYESEVYADPANWLCRPDTDDVCDENLDATIVNADGSTEIEPFELAQDPPIDCFYVYPTVSVDEQPNSDLIPDPDFEGMTVRNQAARLASACRLYAPVYRQATLTWLLERLGSEEEQATPPAEDPGEVAYESVLDAWKHYMANDNDGRGVVLVGHSQGSGILNQLLQNEIDNDPQLRGQLVSALLIGSTVAVPEGDDVGGDFANIPLCRAPEQTGCVISYASFQDTAPPPEGTFFGRAEEGVAACTNPADLTGSRATLKPYFQSDRSGGPFAQRIFLQAVDEPWARGVEVTTPWVTLPDFVEAECVMRDGFSYLEITVLANPSDPRTDEIGGHVPLPSFGLHIIDVNVAMGDLVEIVRQQAEAYTGGAS